MTEFILSDNIHLRDWEPEGLKIAEGSIQVGDPGQPISQNRILNSKRLYVV